MTVGAIIGIVLVGILGLIGIGFSFFFLYDAEYTVGGIIGISCSILIAGAIIGGICFWQFNTESGARALKSQESNFNGGVERIVKVYDMNGNVLETYEGKFDVDCKTDSPTPYIVFDDENGKRHMIFYPTGTVTIDEK